MAAAALGAAVSPSRVKSGRSATVPHSELRNHQASVPLQRIAQPRLVSPSTQACTERVTSNERVPVVLTAPLLSASCVGCVSVPIWMPPTNEFQVDVSLQAFFIR